MTRPRGGFAVMHPRAGECFGIARLRSAILLFQIRRPPRTGYMARMRKAAASNLEVKEKFLPKNVLV